jgi:hypothetical protein
MMTRSPRAPRCLLFYPWNLDEPSGALVLFLSYSQALKSAGYRLDCYAPSGVPESMTDGLYHGVFENVFVAPDRDSPVTMHLEALGSSCQDTSLPEKTGRDEASMAAAGVLASISNYDVVGIQYTRCHSLKQMLPPGLPVVIFTYDLDSLVGLQEEMISGVPMDYTLEDEASRLKPFPLVTVVGPDDRRALHSVEPDMSIVEAPFTVPVEEVMPIRVDSPGVLLWVSSSAPFHRLSFFWFWKKVWPRIRSACPDCRLVIAGRMSEVAKQLGARLDPQVSVLGVVDNTDSLYRESDVLIAPYYFGLGIKTKVIEALGKGIPVATTTLGIHNTHIQPGREAIVSDEAAEYAKQVINLISSPALRSELARNGREYVRRWHDPQKALMPFVEAFETVRRSKKTSSKSRAGTLRELRDPLRHLVPWAVERCRSNGIQAVAFYGAGSHTRLLVPIWKAAGGPTITKIVVTGEPSEATLNGIPVVSARHFDPSHVDAIVLSSHGYERDMAAICSDRWPSLPVFPIWRPFQPDGRAPDEDFEAVCHDRIPTELYDFSRRYDHHGQATTLSL